MGYASEKLQIFAKQQLDTKKTKGKAMKVRRIIVTKELIAHALTTNVKTKPTQVIKGLPPDARIISAWYSQILGAVVLLAEHKSFDNVESATAAPIQKIIHKEIHRGGNVLHDEA